MRASACASPWKAEGGTGRPPQKKQGGRGGRARERPTATKLPANTTRGGQTPHPEGTKDRTPKGAQGDHPAKTGSTKPGTAAHRGKGHPKCADTHHAGTKKKSRQPSMKERGWGDRDHKARDRDSQRPTPQSQSKTRKKKTHPGNATKESGAQPRPGPSTHAHTARPCQERQETSRARAQAHTPAQHPQPGGAGDHAGRAHEHTHTPTPPQGVAGRSRNPDTSTHAHTAHRNRKCQGAGGACTQPRASQIPNHERWGAGRNPSPTTNTTKPSRQKRDDSTNRTQTHPAKTPARTGGVTETHTQPQPGPKHKHHTTVGNPVSKARALRQPVPCS